MDPCTLLLPFLIMGGVAAFAIWRRRSRSEALSALADELGLAFDDPGLLGEPRLHGVLDGHRVLVDSYKTGGKHKQTWTRVRVRIGRPLPPALRVRPEGFGQQIGKLFGTQDLQLGDPLLDSALLIQGHAEEDTRAYLTRPEIAAALLEIQRDRDSIDDDTLTLVDKGFNDATIRGLLMRAMPSARALREAREIDWDRILALPGLRVVGRQLDEEQLVAELRGHRVTVEADPVRGTTRIQVPTPAGLPRDLVVRRGESDLGHPILDRMIDAGGATREHLRDLLGRDEVIEDLLAVVHGYPGSMVTGTAITLHLPTYGHPDLAGRVQDVVRLADALDRAVG